MTCPGDRQPADGADKTSNRDFTGRLHSAPRAAPLEHGPSQAAGTASHRSPYCNVSSNTQAALA